MKRLSSIITVVSAGAALSIGGCHKSADSTLDVPVASPSPQPDATVASDAVVAPDAVLAPVEPEAPGGGQVAEDGTAAAPSASPLPTWDEVVSGHPQGATNPPRPVLVVNSDATRCWKEWVGGMRPDPDFRRIAASGGRVLAAGEAPNGTEVQCPTGAGAVVEAWARTQEP